MPSAPTAPTPAPSPVARRQPTWPWAAGSILAVVVVFAATLAGRHIVVDMRQAAAVVPAPSTPTLPVAAVTGLRTPITLAALDAGAGHLVALTAATETFCPPVRGCPAAPPLAAFVVLDGASGAELARTPLGGQAQAAAASGLLLTDSSRHLAYAIAPRAVTVFSTLTGERTGGYALPGVVSWQRETGAALDGARNALLLAGAGQLLALDAASGRQLAARTLDPSAARVEGSALDTAHSRLYLLQCTAARCLLAAYSSDTLQPTGQWPLSAGMRLGPLDEATRALYLFAANGTVSSLALDDLAASTGTISTSAAPTPVDALGGARALAVDPAQPGIVIVASATAVELRAATHGTVRASLPLRVAWPASSVLPLDATRGLLYLPTSRGEVVIARDTTYAQPLRAGTAVALARAALARFLPDTNQSPPFVSVETFPLGEGTRPTDYWIHFSDLGWRGPYAGSATTQVSARGGTPGAYTVTFSIGWYQLFPHAHRWVTAVAPDGSVRLASESGDVVP